MSTAGTQESTKEQQNGVDGLCKTPDPSECDPCIEEKRRRGQFWEDAERKLRDRSGLSRKGLYYVGALVLALVLLFIVIIILAALWPSTPHHQEFPVCNDAACLRASAQIQQYMNQSVPKCDDIFGWACGQWLATTSLPNGASKWNQIYELEKQEAVRIRELITTFPLPLHRGTVEWKLKYLYDACVEVDNVNSDDSRPLDTIISELGDWSILRNWNMEDFDYKVVLNHLHAKYGATPYFKISVIPNPRSPGNSSISISPSGLGLPDRAYYYMESTNAIIKAYKQLIRDVVINLNAPKNQAEKFANDIFHYEKRIAEITPELGDLMNPVNTYNPIKVSELKFTTTTLPLQDILSAMYPSANIDGDTEVIVTHPDYLLKVSQIIASTDRASMNSYMIWSMVREFLPYLSSQFTAAVNAYNSELYGIKMPLQRWEFCINMVKKMMPLAIDVLLDRQNPISTKTKDNIKHMFENIETIVTKHLDNYRGHAELFSHLRKKVSTLKLQIGLPPTVKSDSFIKGHYTKMIVLKASLSESFKNAIKFLKAVEEHKLVEPRPDDYIAEQLSPEVKYLPSSNTIVVPRMLLSAPFVEDKYPKSIIYGRIGVDLAKAFVSSILPYESAWSADSKLLSPFHLSVNDSIRLTKYPTECLATFSKKNNLTTVDNPSISLDSLKYLSAIQIAHEALESDMQTVAHVHQPSLEIYEDSALYYLSHVQKMCTRSTKQQDLYDNIINLQLSEMSLLRMVWYQHSMMADSFQCAQQKQTQCSDIF